MARTGRFGRLPTESPDLSSQIVSLLEQWQAAEDDNIYNAWLYGGKVDGKKVTDKRLLDYYRKRRDSYDREDPEWDEWNNQLFQMRYRIADSKMTVKYRNGKANEMDMARHYRQWARKMPKNSEFYRSLMAQAGQMAQAAQAGRSGGGGGGGGGSGSSGYTAAYNRLQAIDKSHVKPLEDYHRVLNYLALSAGIINEGESIEDITTMDAGDFNAVMANVDAHLDSNPELRAQFDRLFPEFKGKPITWPRYERMIDRAISGRKMQAKIASSSVMNQQSWAASYRNEIASFRALKAYDTRLDVFARYEEARAEWQQDRKEAETPDEFTAGDDSYVKTLNKLGRRLLKDDPTGSQTDEYGAMMAEAAAVMGRVDEVPENAESLSGSGIPLTELARAQQTQYNGLRMLEDGTAFLMRTAPKLTEAELLLGQDQEMQYGLYATPVNAATGRPAFTDPRSMLIPRKFGNGKAYAEVIEGVEIKDADGVTQGFRGMYDGHYMFKLRHPQQPDRWFYTTFDVFADTAGIELQPGSNGTLVIAEAGTDQTYADQAADLISRTPAAITEEIAGAPPVYPGANASDAKVAEYERETKEWTAVNRAVEEAYQYGLDVSELPSTIAGLENPDADPTQVSVQIAELENVFRIDGILIKNKDDQRAYIRDYLRRTWDEDSQGPIPRSLMYDDADAQVINPDGSQVTPLQSVTQIPTEEVTPDQPQPETATPSYDPLSSVLSPTWWDEQARTELDNLDAAMTVLGNGPLAYETSTAAAINHSDVTIQAWEDTDAPQLVNFMSMEEGMTDNILARGAQELDDIYSLKTMEGTARIIGRMDVGDDPLPTAVAAQLGEMQGALESREPALEAWAKAEGLYRQQYDPLSSVQTPVQPEVEPESGIAQEPLGVPGVTAEPASFDDALNPSMADAPPPRVNEIPAGPPQMQPRETTMPKTIKTPRLEPITPIAPVDIKAPRLSIPKVAPTPKVNLNWSPRQYAEAVERGDVPEAPPPPDINEALKQL